MASECNAFLAKDADDDRASDEVAAFVISQGCFDVAEMFDGEVTTDAHEQVVSAVRPSLEIAIRALGSSDLVGKMTALSGLITAIRRAPSAESH
jgi:hypothetical protein